MPDNLFDTTPEPIIRFLQRRDQHMLNTVSSIQSMVGILYSKVDEIEDDDEKDRTFQLIAETLSQTVGPALQKLSTDETASMGMLAAEMRREVETDE